MPPDTSLALNRMGSFDWDLDSGLMHLDEPGLEVFDLRPDEYDSAPITISQRLLPAERARIDALITRALSDGTTTTYGAYFRIGCRDGSWRWAHAQGRILRDGDGRPHRVVGIVRDATQELMHPAERLALDEERRRQTSVLEEITAALGHAITVQDVTDVLRDTQGMGRLGAVSMVLGLVEGDRLRVGAQGLAAKLVPELQHTRLDEGLPMNKAARTMTPVFITSREEYARGYPRLWPHIEPLDVSAGAYLPLIAQARPIGALGLHFRNKDDFTPEEHTLLVALSSSLAQSLQRAMLFDQEHEIAKGLQTAMLPRSIPRVPGTHIAVRYRSARLGRDVGGDWYDAVPLPGGRVGTIVGDIQGHDTHAAAVMGQLRIALRAYAAEGHSPATVMARASAFLCELDTDRFATCTYAEADPATGALQLVRAGHLDPLLRHADGACRPLPTAGGLPLGLSAQFGRLEYPVTQVELEPGETLVMCTDGLIERPGTDLDEGMRLLTEVVRRGPQDVEELADNLCEAMAEHGAGQDDMALLLLRREGGALPQLVRRLHQDIAPADPEALTTARHMIREAVRAWGLRERSDEVELVTDELVTNALLHTDRGALVTVRMLDEPEHRLRVEVEDRSSTWPRRREPGESSVSGRGLLLVDRLTDTWGVESRGTGKCVWCEFTGHGRQESGP